jgi:hypothetical protein
VACKVEVLLEENPKLALDDAFRKVHSEFGIFGFSDLAESYTKSIEKRYRGFFWEEVKTLLMSYRIVFPIGMIYILYWLSVYTRPFGYELSLPIWGGIFIGLGLVFIIVKYWNMYNIDKSLKNYVSFRSSTNSFTFFNFMMQLNLFGMRFLENPDYSISFSSESILTWLSILSISACFISIFLIPRVLNRSIEEAKRLQAIYEG